MRGALDVHAHLLADGVQHEVLRLPAPVVSADDLPAVLDLPASSCAVVRCYVADDRVVAVLVRAGCVPDPGRLLEACRVRRLRVATVEEVNAATDFAALLLGPVALGPDVTLLVDEDLLTEPDLRLHLPAGEARVAVALRAGDLLAATGGRAVALRARPRHPSERPGWDGVVPMPEARRPTLCPGTGIGVELRPDTRRRVVQDRPRP